MLRSYYAHAHKSHTEQHAAVLLIFSGAALAIVPDRLCHSHHDSILLFNQIDSVVFTILSELLASLLHHLI